MIGGARFVAPRRVAVAGESGSRLLEGEQVVINLASRPAMAPIPGLADAEPLTSETLLRLERIPPRLVVLGGGYVGLELAQAMHRFGSSVTVVERGPQLLAREDDDVAEAVADILREDGIDVRLGTESRRVERLADGSVRVELVTADGVEDVVADDLLAAFGRVPGSEGVGFDAAGVDVDERGFVRVDERLGTTAANTFAVGRHHGRAAVHSRSFDDYRIVKANLNGGGRTTTDRLIPYTIYLDPELGRVGLTEREARRRGYDVRVAKLPAIAVPRARTLRATRGLLKGVVERESDRIFGAAILARNGGEVAAVIQTAMLGNLPAPALRDAMLAHPTMAEGLNALFGSWVD